MGIRVQWQKWRESTEIVADNYLINGLMFLILYIIHIYKNKQILDLTWKHWMELETT